MSAAIAEDLDGWTPDQFPNYHGITESGNRDLAAQRFRRFANPLNPSGEVRGLSSDIEPEERHEASLNVAMDVVEEPLKATSKISFPNGSSWSAVSDDWALSMALNEAMPPSVRVMFAAMSRVNPRSGVSIFHMGELREILGKGDKATTSQVVTNALAQARREGYVLPGSTARRVLLSTEATQRGGSSNSPTPMVGYRRARAAHGASGGPKPTVKSTRHSVVTTP